MSITAVKPYFRAKLDALDYTEWSDGFNFENIPEALLDRAYHLEIGTITSGPANQTTHVFSYPLTVRVFLKGFKDPAANIDDAVGQAETILSSILDVTDRLGATIKDVINDSIDIVPLAGSNDNHLILEMNFTAVINCFFD